MPRSVAREITSFSKKELVSLFKKTQYFIKKMGLDIRLAPKQNELAKILIIIPRKAGNAPKRNRLKRRLKSIFYEEQLFQKKFDWIILATKEGIDISYTELRKFLLETSSTAQKKS